MVSRDKNFRPDPNDCIIVVMGPTGSGKTNFINKLTGNVEKTKASSLKSATQNVTPFPIQYGAVRVVLVDTPGFDDTHRPDIVILQLIADWLTQRYPDGNTLRITGIVYLHRITDNRVAGSVYKNLKMFGGLCGDLPLRRARLVTTMWDEAKDHAVAEERHNELLATFWKELIDAGAVDKKFENNYASGFQIIEDLLQKVAREDELLLQEELVEQRKRINETEAGKVLSSQYQHLLYEQKNILQKLADRAKMQSDPAVAECLDEEYNRVNAMLQKTFDEMQAMRIPLSRRIHLWLFGGKTRAKAIKFDNIPR